MKKQRPVNLVLKTIHFPITAIASILHRVSGVIIFVMLGFLLWLLGLSLSSQQGFMQATAIMHNVVITFLLWGFLTALAYHICGGIRHLLMDFGYIEEDIISGTRSAKVTLVLTVLLSILMGIFLW